MRMKAKDIMTGDVLRSLPDAERKRDVDAYIVKARRYISPSGVELVLSRLRDGDSHRITLDPKKKMDVWRY